MTEALAVRPVTSDELALVKQTVANGATDAELKLYLFDCARQGVHPLDRLLHFTKRGGKYTPVTSIDFMRTRAADTGEYAGSDDAVFTVDGLFDPAKDLGKQVSAATVTVYRLVQGQRCAFTATARWSEYKPEQNDFMWKRMPHTMLAKCAEALALRKGFPRQLAGLYAREEMDQAGTDAGSYIVQAPASPVAIPAAREGERENASDPNAGDSGALLPSGVVRIISVTTRDTKNANVKQSLIVLSDGREVRTIKTQLAALCEQCAQDGTRVTVETKPTKWGEDLLAVFKYDEDAAIDAEIAAHDAEPPVF